MTQLHLFAPLFNTVYDVARHATKCGNYFFSPDTMAFFGTKFPDSKVYGNKYFITRESSRKRFSDDLYVVREITVYPDGHVNIFSIDAEVIAFKTLGRARNVIHDLLNK